LFSPHLKSVRTKSLRQGDHVAVRRSAGYTHHGIYVSEERVIHFSDERGLARKSSARVVATSLDFFLAGGDPVLRVHRRRSNPNKIVERAEAILAGSRRWRPYGLVHNNCEHFASYCATGKRRSEQVRRVAAATATFTAMTVGAVAAARRRRT